MSKLALVVFVISLTAANVARAAPHPESFQIPNHDEVKLSVPEGWASKLSQPPGEVPPTITLMPKTGKPFQVMITAIWRKGADGTIYETALRQQTETAAEAAQQSSVEQTLVLKEITGTDGRGYYFTATDRAPKPDEFKYMTQGMLRLGNLALAFTILTNGGQADVVTSALQLLSTAEHK